jgi:hypothetical protein
MGDARPRPEEGEGPGAPPFIPLLGGQLKQVAGAFHRGRVLKSPHVAAGKRSGVRRRLTASMPRAMRTFVRMTPSPYRPRAELDGALQRGHLRHAIRLAAEVAEDDRRPIDLELRSGFRRWSTRPRSLPGRSQNCRWSRRRWRPSDRPGTKLCPRSRHTPARTICARSSTRRLAVSPPAPSRSSIGSRLRGMAR